MPEMKDAVEMSDSDRIHAQVVDGGFCIGCGICAHISPRYKMNMDDFGTYKPVVADPAAERADEAFQVCPFGASTTNEDQIGAKYFEGACDYTEGLGFHQEIFAGYATEDSFRKNGSSGGLVSWIASELLRSGAVDGIIHVRPTPAEAGEPLFAYYISTNMEEILSGSKSKYYPVELSGVLEKIRDTDGKFAVVGLPCFLKGIRLACEMDKILGEKIVYQIGLVCGHMKSSRFAEFLAWQAGILPGSLRAIDFRVKIPGRSANRYGVRFSTKANFSDQDVTRKMDSFFGYSWGVGLFRNSACYYCDDVFAEVADVVIGDAWLPRFVGDSAGTSIVVSRNKKISRILENGLREKRIHLEKQSVADALLSQASGIRHRREGLQHRLYRAKGWLPKKRVEPKRSTSMRMRRVFEMRQAISSMSHERFQIARNSGNLADFLEPMKRQLISYEFLYSKYGRNWAYVLPEPVLWRVARAKAYLTNLLRTMSEK
jgi:coenzyme F420-reducing hydrogenase beta subunit